MYICIQRNLNTYLNIFCKISYIHQIISSLNHLFPAGRTGIFDLEPFRQTLFVKIMITIEHQMSFALLEILSTYRTLTIPLYYSNIFLQLLFIYLYTLFQMILLL